MAHDMRLEPYAARAHWGAEEPFSPAKWKTLLADFAEEIARRATESGTRLIGHIKGIARPAEGGYVHVSVVSAGHPANVHGQIPKGLRELTLVLNVHVYGLPWSGVRAAVEGAAGAVSRGRNCSVSVETVESSAHFGALHMAEKTR